MSESRLDYGAAAPKALAAMLRTNAYLDKASLPQILRRLVELRVSQINKCSYCIWLHAKQADDLGESKERIAAIEHWQNASCFDAAERAAFAWTEAVTRIAEDTPSDALYKALFDHFTDEQVVDLTAAISSMNAMNRLAISFRHEAPE
jgi:AhpD family alkylhydroperoxidase